MSCENTSSFEYRNLTYKEYQNIAYSILKECNFDNRAELPLNIEFLIEKYGFDIIPFKNLFLRYGIKGLLAKYKGRLAIYIDKEHYCLEENNSSYLFTLAEEFSHLCIHKAYYENINSVEDSVLLHNSITDKYKYIEQQARNVASFLLFPKKVFDNYIINFINSHISAFDNIVFENKECLSRYIAELISKELNFSKDILFYIIDKRYPDLLVDKVSSNFHIKFNNHIEVCV